MAEPRMNNNPTLERNNLMDTKPETAGRTVAVGWSWEPIPGGILTLPDGTAVASRSWILAQPGTYRAGNGETITAVTDYTYPI